MLKNIVFGLLAFHLILLLVYIYLIWYRNFWKKRGLPTARPFTLIGTFPSIITRRRNLIFDMQDVYRDYKTKYRAVGVFVTRTPQILILDPKLAHDIIVTNFSNFHDTISSSWVNNRKADKYISRNPFWCGGDEWKIFRTDLVAGLTQKKIKQALPIWEHSCKKLRDFLEEETKSHEEVETKDVAYRYTADVMSDFIWGIDSGTFTYPHEPNTILKIASKWTEAAFNMLGYSFVLTIAPFVRYLYPFRFNPKDTDEFFSKLTRDAVKFRQENEKDKERTDFLNHLLMLRAKKNISHDDMVGHSLSILMDGYETTGNALMHSLLHLSKNFEVQEKLYKEITKTFAENGDGLSYESICAMPYLEQCIYETLRLISLIPIFSRICTKATKILIASDRYMEIEKGMITIIPTYSFHHDENYFPDPETYNPERFNNAAHVDLMKKGILLAFSDGPRICAGNRIALLTIKTAVIEILRNYELHPGSSKSEVTKTDSFVLTVEGNVMLVFKKRSINN